MAHICLQRLTFIVCRREYRASNSRFDFLLISITADAVVARYNDSNDNDNLMQKWERKNDSSGSGNSSSSSGNRHTKKKKKEKKPTSSPLLVIASNDTINCAYFRTLINKKAKYVIIQN